MDRQPAAAQRVQRAGRVAHVSGVRPRVRPLSSRGSRESHAVQNKLISNQLCCAKVSDTHRGQTQSVQRSDCGLGLVDLVGFEFLW